MPSHDPQMLKGVLTVLLLQLLSQEDSYGYGIVSRLRDAGFTDVAEGTVYPALTRLEGSGALESYLLRSSSGPARKYYRTTDAGRTELAEKMRSWTDLVDSVGNVIATTATPTAPSQRKAQP